MTALHEAVADAARQQAGIVQEYVGDDVPVLDQVLETQAEVTGIPVEELREKARRPDRTEKRVRRRASLILTGSFPAVDLRVRRLGRVSGDGGGLHLELGTRLRRGRLLTALNRLRDVADQLR